MNVFFFSKNIRIAYRGTHNKDEGVEHVMPYECYYCSNFYAWKRDFENHIKVCASKPGVVYDFNLQNVVTFEDDIKYKGDIPLCVFAGFETTAPTDDCLNPENKSMYNHSLSELGDMSYLTAELAMRNEKTAKQLRDAVINVDSKKRGNAIVEMFNTELKFACDILIK